MGVEPPRRRIDVDRRAPTGPASGEPSCARPDPDGCANGSAQRGVETGAQFPGRHQQPCGADVWLPGHHDRRVHRARVTHAVGERKSLLSHTLSAWFALPKMEPEADLEHTDPETCYP